MINHDQNSDECAPRSPQDIPILDPVPPSCGTSEPSLKRVQQLPDLGWLEEQCENDAIGQSGLCDPMLSGHIVNDLENPCRNTVYRYAKSLEGNDQAVTDLFRNIVVIDDDGKAFPVPIMWGTQERAVAVILQDSVRKDNSLIVDQIKLPFMAVYSSDLQFNQSRYVYHGAIDYLRSLRPDYKPGFTINERYERDTIFGISRGLPVDITYNLIIWTKYVQDMNQIIEQVMPKIAPMGYIRVRGIQHEIPVKLVTVQNNLNYEPGDQKNRVIKYIITMTAETFLAQPIRRQKAVLKEKIDLVDNVDNENITNVLNRIEEIVKEIHDTDNK